MTRLRSHASARLGLTHLFIVVLGVGALAGPAAASAGPLRGTSPVSGPEKFEQYEPPYVTQWPANMFRLGDIDGDGRADFAPEVQRRQYGPDERDLAVTLFGVFGRTESRPIDLEADRDILRYDALNRPFVRAAGDVNGDGTDDLLAPVKGAGDTVVATDVLFGGAWTRAGTFTRSAGGFRIANPGTLTPTGDVNGDGFDDLLAYGSTTRRDDVSAIIFGAASAATVDARRPGARGVALRNSGPTPVVADYAGVPTGDFNGDGLGDFAVVPVGASPRTGTIVYGTRRWSPMDVAAPGVRGRLVREMVSFLEYAADVTGDGRDDLFASGLEPTVEAATVHVVPGAAGNAPVTIGAATMPIEGTETGDITSDVSPVVPIGDQNGDGRADLLVGARTASGATLRLVAGRSSGTLPTLSSPVVPGLSGTTRLVGVGDVDGDGSSDAFAFQDQEPITPRRYGTLVTRNRDVLPPDWITDPAATPSSFRVGAGATRLSATTTEDGALEMVIQTSAGDTVGTVRLPGGPAYSGAWDGRLNGRALRPGNYRTTVTPVDPSGNRGSTRTVAFTIVR
jgi:hypothetical protein